MSTCITGQLPYRVDYAPQLFEGNSPAEACQKNGIAYNGYWAVIGNGTICEVGYSGSGDQHAILTMCDAAAPETPASAPTNTVTCSAACTVTVVHEISLPPLQISPADGASIAGAVLAVWALGWGIRMLIRVLYSDGNSTSDES